MKPLRCGLRKPMTARGVMDHTCIKVPQAHQWCYIRTAFSIAAHHIIVHCEWHAASFSRCYSITIFMLMPTATSPRMIDLILSLRTYKRASINWSFSIISHWFNRYILDSCCIVRHTAPLALLTRAIFSQPQGHLTCRGVYHHVAGPGVHIQFLYIKN